MQTDSWAPRLLVRRLPHAGFWGRVLMALGLACCAGVPAASAQAPAGDATYKTQCAACHDSTSPRVPTRAALQQRPAAAAA